MSKLVVRKSDGQEIEFKDTIGHQVGNGAVQIMMGNGEQRIFNNFIEVSILLTAKEKKEFKARMAKAEADAKAKIDAQEAAYNASQSEGGAKLEAVPQH